MSKKLITAQLLQVPPVSVRPLSILVPSPQPLVLLLSPFAYSDVNEAIHCLGAPVLHLQLGDLGDLLSVKLRVLPDLIVDPVVASLTKPLGVVRPVLVHTLVRLSHVPQRKVALVAHELGTMLSVMVAAFVDHMARVKAAENVQPVARS